MSKSSRAAFFLSVRELQGKWKMIDLLSAMFLITHFFLLEMS